MTGNRLHPGRHNPTNMNLYYKAYTDEEGETLRSRCDYRIEGKGVDSRWWSITVYAEDNFLIPNKEKRYSWNKYNIQKEANGQFVIKLSKARQEGNWIPLGDYSGNIGLALRLYHPGKIIYKSPETSKLPKIIREECR